MHLANEVDESLPGFGHALLRPIRELELSDRPGLAVLQKQGGRGSRLAERANERLLFSSFGVFACRGARVYLKEWFHVKVNQ